MKERGNISEIRERLLDMPIPTYLVLECRDAGMVIDRCPTYREVFNWLDEMRKKEQDRYYGD